MLKFNLESYKGSCKYLILFNVMFKKDSLNKDQFLDDMGITPSSYRRAEKSEQNIGVRSVMQLSKHFGYKLMNDSMIDELENFSNKIYYNMYYKIFDTYEEDLEYISNLEKEKYLIFPIIKLLKLFLQINAPTYTSDTLKNSENLYNEIKDYKEFYLDTFSAVFELFEISFEDSLLDRAKFKKYDNGMAYFILSSRCHLQQKYVESLYFANKSKEILLLDGNYKRLFYLNHIIMNSLIKVESYDECYEIAYKQKLALEALKMNGYELNIAKDYIVLSLTGMKKYTEVHSLLANKEKYNLTELTCLLISKYMIDKNEYIEYFKNEIDLDSFESNIAEFYSLLNKYLVHSEKRALNKLEINNLSFPFIKYLK